MFVGFYGDQHKACLHSEKVTINKGFVSSLNCNENSELVEIHSFFIVAGTYKLQSDSGQSEFVCVVCFRGLGSSTSVSTAEHVPYVVVCNCTPCS